MSITNAKLDKLEEIATMRSFARRLRNKKTRTIRENLLRIQGVSFEEYVRLHMIEIAQQALREMSLSQTELEKHKSHNTLNDRLIAFHSANIDKCAKNIKSLAEFSWNNKKQ